MYLAEELEKCIQNVDGKTLRNYTLRTPAYAWEDNIKMNIKEIGWRLRTDSSSSEYRPVLDSFKFRNEPPVFIKCWKCK
jgi:hypothetical protein